MTRPNDELSDLDRQQRRIRSRNDRVCAFPLRTTLARLADLMALRLIFGHRKRITEWPEPLAVLSRIAVHHLPRAGKTPQWEALPKGVAVLARNVAMPPPPLFPAQKET